MASPLAPPPPIPLVRELPLALSCWVLLRKFGWANGSRSESAVVTPATSSKRETKDVDGKSPV